MNYINNENNLSISVPENFKLVPKTKFKDFGISEKYADFMLFMFLNKSNFDTFNVTKDGATFQNENQALTIGVKRNIQALKDAKVNVLEQENIVLPNGRNAFRIFSISPQNIPTTTFFLYVKSMLICLSFVCSETNKLREQEFIEIANSIE